MMLCNIYVMHDALILRNINYIARITFKMSNSVKDVAMLDFVSKTKIIKFMKIMTLLSINYLT